MNNSNVWCTHTPAIILWHSCVPPAVESCRWAALPSEGWGPGGLLRKMVRRWPKRTSSMPEAGCPRGAAPSRLSPKGQVDTSVLRGWPQPLPCCLPSWTFPYCVPSPLVRSHRSPFSINHRHEDPLLRLPAGKPG